MDAGITAYDYMDTSFCCKVEKDKWSFYQAQPSGEGNQATVKERRTVQRLVFATEESSAFHRQGFIIVSINEQENIPYNTGRI